MVSNLSFQFLLNRFMLHVTVGGMVWKSDLILAKCDRGTQ